MLATVSISRCRVLINHDRWCQEKFFSGGYATLNEDVYIKKIDAVKLLIKVILSFILIGANGGGKLKFIVPIRKSFMAMTELILKMFEEEKDE